MTATLFDALVVTTLVGALVLLSITGFLLVATLWAIWWAAQEQS